MEVTKHETYEISLDDHDITIQYYPDDHRAEISSDILNPRNNMDDEEILTYRLNLEYDAREYGEPAYKFIEVFLEQESGIQLETSDQIHTLLEPNEQSP